MIKSGKNNIFRHMSIKIDIIKLYIHDYLVSYSGRDIARKLNINHQTALNKLNELVDANILDFIKKGRNKDYFINLNNLRSLILLEMAEHKNSLDVLNKELKILIQELLPFCESLILFGSFASGKYDKNSDIDFVIVGKSNKLAINKVIKTKSREINIKYVTKKEFETSINKKNHLAIEILKNHAIYGDVSLIVNIFLRWYIGRR